MAIEEELHRLADAGFAIANQIRLWREKLFHFPRPKPLTITLISERAVDGMADILTYEATLPAVPAGTDVESQVFSYTVNGQSVGEPESLPADAIAVMLSAPQDSEVTVSLHYVDDAGNLSAARTQTFVATDTIAPDAPGEFGEIRLVGEAREETPATPEV